jgi:hypothetical protein
MEAELTDLEVIDFEKRFVEPRAGSLYNYLDALERFQRSLWEAAWSDFRSLLSSLRGKDIILSLHATLVRPLYGVRSPVLMDFLRDFDPSICVTLIDDVYTKWSRTERRAGQLDWRGRPTLEQLISARRAEIFLGDILARNLRSDSTLGNYVLAVRHPARTLSRLVFGSRSLLRIYWSFPISEPRRMQSNGDSSGIDEITRFLSHAAAFERENPCVCFCPLTIDELPLTSLLSTDLPPSETVEFRAELRWNVRDFYGRDEILLSDDTSFPSPLLLRREQVVDVQGMIPADVRTRDYRLVMQSQRLVVFNPFFGGKLSRGVDSEIRCATALAIPVEIYQDPNHDPDNLAKSTFKRSAGALGGAPGQEYITFHESLPQLFATLKQSIIKP